MIMRMNIMKEGRYCPSLSSEMRLFWLIVLFTLVSVSSFQPSLRSYRQGLELRAHKNKALNNVVASTVVVTSMAVAPLVPTALAYEDSDYASETVTAVVSSLRDAGSNPSEVFKAYENIAAIITEGRGVGGSINYQGVQLNRGYIADEDTSIYNPGLTLLTESEKGRLVEAVVKARKAGLNADSWNSDNQFAYEFLKDKLDPLHLVELKGYLSILPFYGAFVYLGVLAVQQFARNIFPMAYAVGAALIFVPMALLVVAGPQ